MNEYPPLLKVERSFITSRHPLLKILLGLGLWLVFFIIPDRHLLVITWKMIVLILIFFATGGPARWKSLLRILLFLIVFLAVIFFCTLLGNLVTNRGNLIFFRQMVLKSSWTVLIAFLIGGTIHYRECVYLGRILRIPPAISSQLLLVILIWGKLFKEFIRVPEAWKSRGITARYLKKHPGMIGELLKVVLYRITIQADRLELTLLSRGFAGRLYTCYTASWTSLDSVTLLAAMIIVLGLFLASTA